MYQGRCLKMKNNFVSSLGILNVMNRNYAALHKSMLRVATGMRINSVADDPSGWAIGQRMSVEIRCLDQATRNAQSSQSMLKVADGAVSSTIDILRTLKEKAIAAANGTMTDIDRRNVQKEFNQYIDQIDDNSLVTFNGQYLLNGSHKSQGQATQQALTNQSLAKDTTFATKLTDLYTVVGMRAIAKFTDIHTRTQAYMVETFDRTDTIVAIGTRSHCASVFYVFCVFE